MNIIKVDYHTWISYTENTTYIPTQNFFFTNPFRHSTIPPLFPQQSTSDNLSLGMEQLYFNPNSTPTQPNASLHSSTTLPYKVKVPQTVAMAKSYIMHHLNNTIRCLLSKPEMFCNLLQREYCLSFYVSCLIYTDEANLCHQVKAMVLNNALDSHFSIMTAKDVPPPMKKEKEEMIPDEFLYECAYIFIIMCGKVFQSNTVDQHLTSWSTKRIKTLYTHMQSNDGAYNTIEPTIINRNFDLLAIANFWKASPELKKVVGIWLKEKTIKQRNQQSSSADVACSVTMGEGIDKKCKTCKMNSALFLQSQKILSWTGLATFKYAYEFAVSNVKTKAHFLEEVVGESRYVMNLMSTMERDLGKEGMPYARLLGYPLLEQCRIHFFKNLAWCAIEFNKFVDLEAWKNYKLSIEPNLSVSCIIENVQQLINI